MSENVAVNSEATINEIAEMLMEMAAVMMSSGAHTARIIRNVSRMGEAFGYHIQITLFQLSIIISVYDQKDHSINTTLIRKIQPLHVNYSVVSNLSTLSWKALDKHLTFSEVKESMDNIISEPRYKRWQILIVVSIANAAFCKVFSGDVIAMIFVAISTFAGLYVRQETLHRNINNYISITLSAFVSALISGLAIRFNIGTTAAIGQATSVLYLIPGILMMNSVIDIFEGYSLVGLSRGINAVTIMFGISFGFLMSLLVIYYERIILFVY